MSPYWGHLEDAKLWSAKPTDGLFAILATGEALRQGWTRRPLPDADLSLNI